MKNVITLLFFSILYTSISAQTEINKTIPAGKAQSIYINLEYADVQISSWDRSEIRITGTVMINQGDHNDAFKLESRQQGGSLNIKTFIEGIENLPKYTTVKKDGKTYYFKEKSNKEIRKELGEGSYSMISNGVEIEISLQIKIPAGLKLEIDATYGDIKLENCQNKMDIQNTYGHILAIFGQQDFADEIKLQSTYSFVDVSLPARSAVSVELDSNYGKIYTDHDINIDKNRSKEKNFSNRIVGTLNRGGKILTLKADYNNIYLRKS